MRLSHATSSAGFCIEGNSRPGDRGFLKKDHFPFPAGGGIAPFFILIGARQRSGFQQLSQEALKSLAVGFTRILGKIGQKGSRRHAWLFDDSAVRDHESLPILTNGEKIVFGGRAASHAAFGRL